MDEHREQIVRLTAWLTVVEAVLNALLLGLNPAQKRGVIDGLAGAAEAADETVKALAAEHSNGNYLELFAHDLALAMKTMRAILEEEPRLE